MMGQLLTVIIVGQANGVVEQILRSSFLALFIYLTLIVLSILTWGTIIKKVADLRLERKRATQFRKMFNDREGNIIALSQEGILPSSSPARLFVAAYEELRLWATLDREHNCIIAERPVIPALERTMDRSIELEKECWEKGTTLLATIASVSPLLGLLGTVYGIYLSFNQMGQSNMADLSTVAPGISEALLTTVAGLLVAIPAVFGHNGILHSVRRIENQLESFANEIINRFDRQIIVGAKPARPGRAPSRPKTGKKT